MKTVYYIGWNASRGAYCSNCFDTPEERETFKRRIYCYPGTTPSEWTKEAFENQEEARAWYEKELARIRAEQARKEESAA